MKRLEGIEGLRPAWLDRPVCTVGVFDGVHRGHRQLLYELAVWARAVAGESCVVTFSQHPLAVLRGIEVPAILSLENRLLEFERHGVDAVVVIDFAQVRELEASAFLDLLVQRLGCTRLLLGFDSHIGRDRSGSAANLPGLGRQHGVEVRIASPVLDREGTKIGSRFIREAIRRGDLAAAANALGRPYCLRGSVLRGAGRGASLGTATANLDVSGQVLPPDGVYLVRVFKGGEMAAGIANLGLRPTFNEGSPRVLEVHVPGWSGEFYGQVLEVRLQRALRPEQRFESADELKRQIRRDLKELERAVAKGEL